MKKIGILTFFWADDFGGMLQCYALKRFVEQLQVGTVDVIPYDRPYFSGRYRWEPSAKKAIAKAPGYGTGLGSAAADKASGQSSRKTSDEASRSASVQKPSKWNVLKGKCKRFCQHVGRRKRMDRFRRAYLHRGRRVGSMQDFSHDVFLLGSDQVWNPDITLGLEPVYFGAFDKKDGAITIAYAASLGGERLADQYDKEIQRLLKHTDVISVREKSSVAYIEEKSGKPVQVMPDPTLLLDRGHWEEIMIRPKVQDYVLIHYTEYNRTLIQTALDHAKRENKKVISLNPIPDCPKWVEVKRAVGPAEFLGYVHDAAYIFTNSFHATVFSLTFRKQFQCFLHSTRGNRMRDLLQEFGLSVEMMGPKHWIDYAGKENIAQRYRGAAETFLREKISEKLSN